MRRFLLRATVLLLIVYFTPIGGFVRPLVTRTSDWFDGTKLVGTGTGFYVSETHVITNHHVIKNCDTILIGGKDGHKTEAKVLGYDIKHDLAALTAPQRIATALRLRRSPLKIGEISIYPDYSSAQGVFGLKRLTIEKIENNLIRSSAGARLGNSGSPLLDENGLVIGVISRLGEGKGPLGFLGLTGYSSAVDQPSLRQFLEQYHVPYAEENGRRNLLDNSDYADYIAVNIGCISNKPWFLN